MKLLEERIKKDGVLVNNEILKVDGFLNHNIDVSLINEMGKEFARIFNGLGINKILTIEASGIGIACIVAQYFEGADVLFAKKHETKNLDENTYAATVTSFTHGRDYLIRVSKKHLKSTDKVLIIDDFLATGHAIFGLLDLANQAGAEVMGVGICIEKAFQGGGSKLRRDGVNLHSLAILDLGGDGNIAFIDDSDTEKLLS